MRRNSVIIKSNAYGLTIRLDPELSFDLLENDLAEKFRESARFFRNAQMALSFTGRELTEEEEYRLIDVITSNAQIQIVCLVDESKEHAQVFKDAVVRTLSEQEEGRARTYRGTLSFGMSLESESTLIIQGDVNPGAKVVCGGDLIILGCCMGDVTAGFGGNRKAYVAALTLKPAVLRIADKGARSAITKKENTGEYPIEPKIAFIRDDHIVLEELTGSIFTLLDDK